MGYFWNHLGGRWDPIDHGRQLTREQKKQIDRRKYLIEDIIEEIEISDDSVIKLYAGLLARSLTATDELLMRTYGERLAKSGPDPVKKLSGVVGRKEETERPRRAAG